MQDNSSSGIYAIFNTVSGKSYIGQAMNIKVRWQQHKSALKGGYHDNRHLQRAWDKYGEESFEFKVLEYCVEDQLDERETYHIAAHRPNGLCYNMQDGGEGSSGRIATAETRLKLSETWKYRAPVSEETRLKIGQASKGRTHSDETRAKMSESAKGKTFSDESRHRMSEARKGKSPSNKGVSPSEDVRRKLSEANKGKTHSEETRRKISESVKKRLKDKLPKI